MFCPYSGADIAEGDLSTEHIFPEAIGGLDGFCIPASRKWNSTVGSIIDGAFVNQEIVQCFREWYQQKGKHKKTPRPVFTHEIPDPTVGSIEVKQQLLADGYRMFIPFQSKEEAPDVQFLVSSDQSMIEKAIEKREKRTGKKATVFLAEKKDIMPISTGFTANGSPLACVKFLFKVAIASAYYVLGEQADRSDLIKDYRNEYLSDKDSVTIQGWTIQFGVVLNQNKMLLIEELYPGCHTVWIRQEFKGTYAYISVYGIIGAKVKLSPAPDTFEFPEEEVVIVNNYLGGEFYIEKGEDLYGTGGDRIDDLYFSKKEIGWFDREIVKQNIICMYCQETFRKKKVFYGPDESHLICPACMKERHPDLAGKDE